MSDQLRMVAGGRLLEKELQGLVIELAHVLGYTVAHFRAARTKWGWTTPVAGDGAGFPDCIFIGHGRLLVRELKVGRNQPSPDQDAWLELFRSAGIDAGIWTEVDWYEGRILADLRGAS